MPASDLCSPDRRKLRSALRAHSCRPRSRVEQLHFTPPRRTALSKMREKQFHHALNVRNLVAAPPESVLVDAPSPIRKDLG